MRYLSFPKMSWQDSSCYISAGKWLHLLLPQNWDRKCKSLYCMGSKDGNSLSIKEFRFWFYNHNILWLHIRLHRLFRHKQIILTTKTNGCFARGRFLGLQVDGRPRLLPISMWWQPSTEPVGIMDLNVFPVRPLQDFGSIHISLLPTSLWLYRRRKVTTR